MSPFLPPIDFGLSPSDMDGLRKQYRLPENMLTHVFFRDFPAVCPLQGAVLASPNDPIDTLRRSRRFVQKFVDVRFTIGQANPLCGRATLRLFTRSPEHVDPPPAFLLFDRNGRALRTRQRGAAFVRLVADPSQSM